MLGRRHVDALRESHTLAWTGTFAFHRDRARLSLQKVPTRLWPPQECNYANWKVRTLEKLSAWLLGQKYNHETASLKEHHLAPPLSHAARAFATECCSVSLTAFE